MRVINNVIIAAVLVLSLNSCLIRTDGFRNSLVFNYNDSTKVIDRVEEPFTSLEVSSGMDVQFIPSTEYRVVAEVPNKMQYIFSTAVYEDGRLMIKTEEAAIIDVKTKRTRIEFRDFPPIKVYCPYLTAVKINGSGDFKAEDLTGDVLIIHGTADDNVHVQHTMQYIDALVNAGKQFEMQLYPDDNHFLRKGNNATHMHNRILNFLQKNL